ncbi:hypothetical protein ABZX51_005170 [Aspergillus tubingensis]
MTAFRGQQSRWLPTFPPQMRHHVSRSQAAFQIGPDFIWADCQPAGRKENRSHPFNPVHYYLQTQSTVRISPLILSHLLLRRHSSVPAVRKSTLTLPSHLRHYPSPIHRLQISPAAYWWPPTRLSFPVRHMG